MLEEGCQDVDHIHGMVDDCSWSPRTGRILAEELRSWLVYTRARIHVAREADLKGTLIEGIAYHSHTRCVPAQVQLVDGIVVEQKMFEVVGMIEQEREVEVERIGVVVVPDIGMWNHQ